MEILSTSFQFDCSCILLNRRPFNTHQITRPAYHPVRVSLTACTCSPRHRLLLILLHYSHVPCCLLNSISLSFSCPVPFLQSSFSSHFLSSHFLSSHFLSSHFLSSHFLSSHFLSSHFLSSHFLSSQSFMERIRASQHSWPFKEDLPLSSVRSTVLHHAIRHTHTVTHRQTDRL